MKSDEDFEICTETCIHETVIQEVLNKQPDEELLADLADLFKNFSDTTRIRILSLLIVNEMCVCDIAAALSATQSAISHQLRILKQSRLVKSRREGKTIYYALADEHVQTIIAMGLEHLSE